MNEMPIGNSTIFFGSQYGVLETSELTNHKGYNDTNIIIYKIHLTDYEHIIHYLITFLDVNEKERSLKYYKHTDKNRFIICRSLLKIALSYHTKLDIKYISIQTLPNKKPYLPTHPNMHFNLSHSGDYAVLAISRNPIGIDIEYINLNYTFQDSLTYIFNDIEIRFLNNSDNKVRTFFSLWTRKESFVKALGIGIDDEFMNIPCLDGLHELDSRFNLKTITHWDAMDFQLGSTYQGSMVFSTQNKEDVKILPLHFPLDISKLLKLCGTDTI